VNTKVRCLSPSWAKRIQSTSSHPTSLWYSLILSFYLNLGLTSGLFTSHASEALVCILCCTLRATCTAHLILFDFITSVIFDQENKSCSSSTCNSPAYCYLLHYSILGQIIIFSLSPYSQTPATVPQCDRPSRKPTQNNRQNDGLVQFCCHVF